MSDRTETVELALSEADTSSRWMMWLFATPILAFAGLAIAVGTQGASDAVTIYVAVVLVAVACLLPYVLTRIIRKVRVQVSNGQLLIGTGVGKKNIPLSHLRARGLKVINLAQHPELTPRLRLWGARMPGLMSGWYSLRNKQKAMIVVTDQRRVSWLRSDSDDVTILLSLKNPERLQALLDD